MARPEDVISQAEDPLDIAGRLAEMETRLMAAFTNGLATLQQVISTALLEQERRNSTFATRAGVEECNRKIDVLSADLTVRVGRLDRLETDLGMLESKLNDRTLSYVKAATAFLASLLALVLTAIVTYTLSAHPVLHQAVLSF